LSRRETPRLHSSTGADRRIAEPDLTRFAGAEAGAVFRRIDDEIGHLRRQRRQIRRRGLDVERILVDGLDLDVGEVGDVLADRIFAPERQCPDERFRSQILTIGEFNALPDLEAPGRLVDLLPFRRKARCEGRKAVLHDDLDRTLLNLGRHPHRATGRLHVLIQALQFSFLNNSKYFFFICMCGCHLRKSNNTAIGYG
jgi:hypothetical protein